ncbi:uncharacterized protein LOC118814040 [Colossoma macropomum]|uniref:uncharacterized protein LOC118814040 n=1 Tax=Colossoma macropomum TaxID=42526 RepID=UPI0018650504|nr:uncharacterized protein LOC118814040 [Colossoma macropomum]
MSEQLEGDTTSPQERFREDGEGEEKTMEQGAEQMAFKGDMWQEEKKEAHAEYPESPAKAEVKQAKVHSVFSLVRSQIRAQTSLDTRRTGMLQLVQRVTRQLDRSKGDAGEPVTGHEVASAEEEVATALEAEEETMEIKEDHETQEKSKEEVCVALLQEVLDSLESMRKEVREELSLLKLESQSSTEEALKNLEARLTQTLTTHMMPQARSRSHLAGPVDGKKHKPLSVPPLVASRRRTLNRTMTTITPKSCPPPTLGPRSMSEPLGGRVAERAGSSGSSTHTFLRGGDPIGPLLGPLGPLPPALPPTQYSKKPLGSKNRVSKVAI